MLVYRFAFGMVQKLFLPTAYPHITSCSASSSTRRCAWSVLT